MTKLLFNKEKNGADELKKILGFIDANFTYQNIESDLIIATQEIISLIGKEVYAEVEQTYYSQTPNQVFLFMVKYPIAVKAYLTYTKINDLSHRSDGRAIRLDDHEKIPFEWMIDRNDAALEKKYYKSLDSLLEYLDQTNVTWKKSKNYQKAHKTIIQSTSDFADVFPLDSRYLLLKMEPGLVLCEKFDIQPRIGKEVLHKLKEDIKNNQLASDDEELYMCIRHAMVFKSLEWAMRRLSVNLFPEGILQSYLLNKNYHGNENEEAAQQFSKDASHYLINIESIIKKRKTSYSSDKISYSFGFNDTDNFITT